MGVTVGTRLGSYEIVSSLGAGGMGEVFLARDTRLERHVALKFIRDSLFADRDRTLRFEREAKTLAALNHPNIATLHGMEEAAGRHFLVMELVDGETLLERIRRHPSGMPVVEALHIARQICEGLEAAHEKGIVHRDLKPANIKITPDDKVKVLDFGLARVNENGNSVSMTIAQSPTISAVATHEGMILGTASYMSPEQARGSTADQRSDIFSFGIVLYEMLTGRQPFPGETISDVIASILARDPDLSALPSGTSPRLGELLKRCLEKNPRRRWQAIGDLRYEIESLLATPRLADLPAAVAAPRPRLPLWKRSLPYAVTALGAALVVAAAAWLLRPATTPAPLGRFVVAVPSTQSIPASTRGALALSPAGDLLAYVANRKVFLRPLADLDAKVIFANESFASVNNVVFSPDGRSIAFWCGGTIFKVSSAGGTALPLAPFVNQPSGLTWAGDSLYFAAQDKIYRVPASGGDPEAVIDLPDGELAATPDILPGGQVVLYTVASGSSQDAWDSATIVTQRIGEDRRTTIMEKALDGRYVPTGHLLFARGGMMLAAPFDTRSLRTSGEPVPVVEGVRRVAATTLRAGAVQLAFSPAGTLVFIPGPTAPAPVEQLTPVLFDRIGAETSLKVPPGAYTEPRWSPDGRFVAFGSDDGRDVCIWVVNVQAGGAPRRLTFGGRDRHPVWSSDSRFIAFQSDRDGTPSIYRQLADGTGVAERLTSPDKGRAHVPLSWGREGKVLLFDESSGDQVTLFELALPAKTVAKFGHVRSTLPTGAVFSPDSRWVAYSVREGTRSNVVFVQPYPATGAMFQVSANSEDGHHQVWARDGQELYYTPGPGPVLIAIPVTAKDSFQPGQPIVLPRPFRNDSPTAARPFDAASQGRFLGLTGEGRSDSASGAGQIHIVLNWFRELNARAPIR